MPKNLVIVESPAKAKTIEKFLGKDFTVVSSFGHIADLPSKDIGIDIIDDFKPKYVVSKDKKSVVKSLKDNVKKADVVWLASDEDREGEAIAWHLFEQLNLDENKTKRIVFHEITKNAILKAVENPRQIDYNLVNAQQARRIVDRLVGYELSPVLWRKIKSGLSAGRVQSVAVRLIVERENDIRNFEPVRTHRVDAEFLTADKQTFKSKLTTDFEQSEEAVNFLETCKDAVFKVDDLKKKPFKRIPAAPFTTSTLQQEASRKLNFPVGKTMRVAQQLYEQGLITYMRTDSVNLSNEALALSKEVIENRFGKNYTKKRVYSTKTKGAQEAHEAIRPTNLSMEKVEMGYDHNRLYSLIWKRTIASQMSDAVLERTTVTIANDKNKHLFRTQGEVVTFDGFLKLYIEGKDDEEQVENSGLLPELTQGDLLNVNYISATERYSRPPYRYSEASLVKKMEELGIGRPSTYAPTISTIQNRGYVEKPVLSGTTRFYVVYTLNKGEISTKKAEETVGADKGKLVPTDIGMIVNGFLVKNFKHVMDYGFTAHLETEFDDIAEGNKPWTSVVKEFYQPFHENINEVKENADREKGERLLGVDPKSGKKVFARLARYGAVVQMGEATEEEKPEFAGLNADQSIQTITLEEALKLFELPKTLGQFKDKDVLVSNGRFGPFVKWDKLYASLPKNTDPLEVDYDQALEIIKAKLKSQEPIAEYKGLPVQKGKGRFGPFIKWNDMFINVSKKYDFDHLSKDDIETLIEAKLKKEREKVVKTYADTDIRIEKARWGRFKLISGKKKLELPKDTDLDAIDLKKAKELLKIK
ncbi:MAG: DNA topoisomerase I [Flavobacteriia bacterium]|nr:MAG: DNA topoisomerase I [Flavobacteriia bacterium]